MALFVINALFSCKNIFLITFNISFLMLDVNHLGQLAFCSELGAALLPPSG